MRYGRPSLDRGGHPFVLQIGGSDLGHPAGDAILPEHTVLGAGYSCLPITDTEVALVAAPGASAASRPLAERLANFCSTLDTRMAA